MKNIKLFLVIAGFISAISCTQDPVVPNETSEALFEASISQELLTIPQINKVIQNTLDATGDFSWAEVSDQVLWSATVHGDGILSIGYGNIDESFRTSQNQRLTDIKTNIVTFVSTAESISEKQVVIYDYPILNVVDVKVEKFQTISELRKIPNIRYLEPNGYKYFITAENNQERSSNGCNQDGETLITDDYRTISPNALISWTFDNHNIEAAWAYSTGAGVTVGLVDTGVSANQPLLGSNFNDGQSSGRSIEKYGTFIDSIWWWSDNYDGPDDKCGHGTGMGSTIASPRNDDFMPVGVAYNCNLISYRATEDVLLDDYHERKGVSDALVQLADRNEVRIISMSVGYPFSIGNVKDAVKYAYSKGKLMFAAGGTSFDFTNWLPVTFPANMTQCVAVTGVTDSGTYQQCDTCHDGSEIEFTIVMERDNDNSRTGTVLGFYDGDKKYVGGSSVATATVAGIAALVAAKHPNWNRKKILNKLRESAEFYPNKDETKGYGNIDALQAVQ